MAERINRVTTGRGDGGTTQLGTGERIAKTDDRISALGDVDELNAHLGLLRVALPKDGPGPRLDALLLDLQHRLFDLGGALSERFVSFTWGVPGGAVLDSFCLF